jgi:hypothetical protein
LEKTTRVLVISKREESQEKERIEKRRRVASLGLKITLKKGLDLGNIYIGKIHNPIKKGPLSTHLQQWPG